MKSKIRKSVSVLLTLVTIFGLFPVSALHANAASPNHLTEWSELAELNETVQPMTTPLSDEIGLEFLLKGFNVLSGRELRNDTINTPLIMQPESDIALRDHYDARHISRTTASTNIGRTVVDWAISAGMDMSVSASAEAGLGKCYSR